MSEHTNCKQLVGTLSDYVDGTLNETLCADLEKHLQECHNCQVVVNTLRKTIELYQLSSSGDSMPEDVRARLFMRLDLEDYCK